MNMIRCLLLLPAIAIAFSACHKKTDNGITYTSDSVTIEIDNARTIYREEKINGGYNNYITAEKDNGQVTAYVISMLAAENGSPKFDMSLHILKMPDGSFRLDSTRYNAMQTYANPTNPHSYNYPTGPVALTHDGTDYVEGSFEGTIQSNSNWIPVKCSFRSDWKN